MCLLAAMLWLPWTAAFKGRQNEYFKSKTLILCAKQILNYLAKYKEIHQIIVIFLKFIICVRGSHCDYSPQVPKDLATPLGVKKNHVLSLVRLATWAKFP
jgi:hypothetical protein